MSVQLKVYIDDSLMEKVRRRRIQQAAYIKSMSHLVSLLFMGFLESPVPGEKKHKERA